MSFRPGTREYWLSTSDNKCQWENYDEDKGFSDCGKKASHVHHIIPEHELLEAGQDPNETTGLPLCQDHHVRNYGDTPFDQKSSFHPDVAVDYDLYRDWKPKAKHLAEITGKSIDYSTSPFADIGKRHRETTKRGERICTGDEFTDRHYIEKMQDKANKYNATKRVSKKHYKEHPKTDKSKIKRWYDLIVNQFK